jgi:hypothetical protein
MRESTKQYYRDKILEMVDSGKHIDAVDVGHIAIKSHTVDKPLGIMQDMIFYGILCWYWDKNGRYLKRIK